eukprot:TRINITY_DN115047_c0_g1_i1.p1 TRINITY_DN115047_c0_g1~~TRINITY_DN115047_c0_g1_i1.p1  ORF type:complete len:142 (-),score=14.64 TRINITY_DN115047_c0_g1_i1:90-515(-)
MATSELDDNTTNERISNDISSNRTTIGILVRTASAAAKINALAAIMPLHRKQFSTQSSCNSTWQVIISTWAGYVRQLNNQPVDCHAFELWTTTDTRRSCHHSTAMRPRVDAELSDRPSPLKRCVYISTENAKERSAIAFHD